VDDDGLEDREEVVYKLEIVTTLPGEVTPARMNPHAPPGMKND
jgi:hypothetical protein